MSDWPLDADAMRRYIVEVADELEAGTQRTLVIVGDALLAWRGLRATTGDVDSVERLDQGLKAAVARVAKRHDLAPAWLNDSAARFRPATFKPEDCAPLLDRPTLRVHRRGRRHPANRRRDRTRARQWRATGGETGITCIEIGRILRVPRSRLDRLLGRASTAEVA